LPDDALRDADVRFTIPMRRGVDSLNVAMSAVVVLYEASRSRIGAT
jgi:tRNA G18 (ribose-2'-O)-methylase SpoU